MVPGSTANVGSGFDVFGIAVGIYSYFSLQQEPKLTYLGRDEIDKELSRNVVFTSFARVLKEFGQELPSIGVWIKNHIPIKRGLGSSSVAIIGGLTLGYIYLRYKGALPKDLENFDTFRDKVMLPLGIEIEGHPDNVTPSAVGGFTISGIDKNKSYYKLSVPENIFFVFVIPEFDISTSSAREALPRAYQREDIVFNLRCATSLVLGIINNDPDLISIGLRDKIHQPYRAKLYKGFEKLLEISSEDISERFIGSFISGSGPTVCCVFSSQPSFSDIEKLRNLISRHTDLKYDIQILSVDNVGARII